MYGLKLYIPLEELNTYIHTQIDERFKDHTFIPIKIDVNEVDLSIEIGLLSADPIESNGLRYKLDLNKIAEENNNERHL